MFAYQKGTVKQVLSVREYGLTKCVYYTRTKTLIVYGAGHGGEWYRYYQQKGTRYEAVAQRFRTAKAGGAAKNGPWRYTMGEKEETQITKAKFSSLTKNLKKGKKRILSSWETLS